ncbi:hypothetical protein M6D93_18820 [Jatrophihabitans telluris]|uniref:Ferric oxidoreductase domain-containing protein n=1 Tax=Jatrophihabitans telluris TaxID=2038343 RepID=A0ABY4QXT6_9ACTN|nr:hypothetical protein [Jatrophihabitans telluris]UQX88313.1 hypothetical protein M6D93_18820 [Jatrophihabitans telluris]
MLTWYLARGAGLAAFAALSVATGLGAFAARRTSMPGRGALSRRIVLQYVHRAAALSGVTLLIAHIAFILADSYARVGWIGALVPMTSGYRPWPVSLGVLGLYLLVAVSVTGALRSRFAQSAKGVRAWRGVHLLSYVAWVLTAGHFLFTGSDSGTWWARAVLVAGSSVVAAGVLARLSDRPQLGRRSTIAPAALTSRPARAHHHVSV